MALAAGGGGASDAAFSPYTGPESEQGYPLHPSGYVIIEEVGQGAFAKVLRAYCPSRSEQVAVKIIALEALQSSMEEIQAEVRAMASIRHPNVLDLRCCFVVGSYLWLVMPLMDKGSAYHVVRQLRRAKRLPEGDSGISEEGIATILHELLQGLEYIHGNHQIHRDIKAGNLLLNSEGRVAIADFGVAGWVQDPAARGGEGESGGGPRRTFVGTPCWMAPEVMEQTRGYNEKADIWSVGITALELAKGYAPYAKLPPMQVLLKTIREPPPSIKSYSDPADRKMSDAFNKFVARCLQRNPKDRPSAHELLSDAFLRKAYKPASKLAETLLRVVESVGSAKAAGGSAEAEALGALARGLKAGEGGLVVSEEAGGAAATPDVAAGAPPMSVSLAPAAAAPEAAAAAPGTTWVFPDELKRQLGISPAPPRPVGPMGDFIEERDDEEETSVDALAAELEAMGGEAGF